MKKVMVIGVAGASGSGKSLLSKTIVQELGSNRVTVVSEDSFYKDLSALTKAERDEFNFDHPDAFDHDLLITRLKELQEGKSVKMPVYDYVTHMRTAETVHLSDETSMIVLEGILILSEPRLRDLMDIRIFVDTPLDTCFIRRLKRDVVERGRTMESVIKQYEKTVRPMFIQFIEPCKRYADLIVPHGGKNRIAVQMIKAQMRNMLEEQDRNNRRAV
ncbi:MAG: uridine kinase [Gammaproteobacteria bacterium]|nr:uridine kinase [Gammaproteobacteria bacterium]